MNPFDTIAPYYDLEHEDLTLDTTMYLRLVRRQAEDVLVLGVGTGRVAGPIAATGVRVCGIDSSEAMLQRARARFGSASPIQLLCDDMRSFQLDRAFNLVIIPLDTFSLLATQEDQLAVLSRCRRHLTTEGHLVIDLTNPLTLPGPEHNGSRHHRFTGVVGDATVSVFDSIAVSLATQTMAVDLMYQIETGNVTHHASTRIDVRWCYRYELEALLRVAGFSSVFAYGDYDQQPYEAESPRLVVEASRVGNTAGDADLN